jgi:uncharacterized protein YndB with AHSA1/START domain
MPSFHDRVDCAAGPEEVWKLLYDPSRFPEWWAGIGSVEVTGGESYTMYPDGYPDYPMAQLLESRHEDHQVTISCLVSDLRFEWRLEPSGSGTQISVEVEIPEAEGQRLRTQQELIGASIRRLAELAAEDRRESGG